jgi:sugar/nucleoside kinase (ribokinase family)
MIITVLLPLHAMLFTMVLYACPRRLLHHLHRTTASDKLIVMQALTLLSVHACVAAVQASADTSRSSSPVAQVFVASAAGLPAGAVADTTGAGDSFIGSVLYGIVTGMTPRQMMMLGAVVAACKCTALGARPGLPTRQQLAPHLLAAVQQK